MTLALMTAAVMNEEQAYYDMLVDYYYQYAAVGVCAPVIENDERTIRARDEAYARLDKQPVASTSKPRRALPEPPPSSSIPSISFGDGDLEVHPSLDPAHPSHSLYKVIPAPSIDTAPRCAGCEAVLLGKAILADDRHWHADCFVCAHQGCDERLEFIEFRPSPQDAPPDQQRKVWCMVHYEEHFGPKCFHCKTPISDSAFLVLDDESLVPPQRTYHALHFFCSSCGDPFVDPTSLERGKETTLAEPYVVFEGWSYCVACDKRLRGPKCSRCRRSVDAWVEWNDERVCQDCWTCDGCSKRLDERFMVRTTDDHVELVLCNGCA